MAHVLACFLNWSYRTFFVQLLHDLAIASSLVKMSEEEASHIELADSINGSLQNILPPSRDSTLPMRYSFWRSGGFKRLISYKCFLLTWFVIFIVIIAILKSKFGSAATISNDAPNNFSMQTTARTSTAKDDVNRESHSTIPSTVSTEASPTSSTSNTLTTNTQNNTEATSGSSLLPTYSTIEDPTTLSIKLEGSAKQNEKEPMTTIDFDVNQTETESTMLTTKEILSTLSTNLTTTLMTTSTMTRFMTSLALTSEDVTTSPSIATVAMTTQVPRVGLP